MKRIRFREGVHSRVLPAMAAVLVVALLSRPVLAQPTPSGSATGTPAAQPRPADGHVVFEDPRYGLRLTLPTGGARVCIVLPAGAEASEGCEGVQLYAIRTRLSRPPRVVVGAALLRFEGWSVHVHLDAVPGPIRPLTEDVVKDYIRTLIDGIQTTDPSAHLHGTKPTSTHDVQALGAHRAIRYFIDTPAPEIDPALAVSREVSYVLAADGAQIIASFGTAPPNEAKAYALAEQAMASIELRPPVPSVFDGCGAIPDRVERSPFALGMKFEEVLMMTAVGIMGFASLLRRLRLSSTRRTGDP